MIIQALVKRYEDTKEVPPGWQVREVSYALEISEEGDLLRILPLETMVDGKKKKRELILPSTSSGRSGINAYEVAYFLCDDGNYMLGLESSRFESARKLYERVLEKVDTPSARAMKAYFSRPAPGLPENFDEKEGVNAKYVFSFNGRRVDFRDGDTEITKAWEDSQTNDGEQIRCLITGDIDIAITLHDKVELQGVTMGKTPLISMNDQTSFRSYGAKPKDPPAQIGKKAAFAYVSALNALLKSNKNHQPLGGDTLVYWAENGDGTEEEIFSWTSQPTENDTAKLDGLMKRLAKGLPIVHEGCKLESRFYLLCLSPNAGRISVRFFHSNTFGNILRNNLTHYERMGIVKAGKDPFIYLPLWVILSETTVKKKSADVAPLLGGQLMQSILKNERYPMTLYQAILNRIRAGEEVNKTKAATIKAILMQNYNEKEVTTLALNTEANNNAYVLGRLFSVLERLQQQSSDGKLNSTIRGRYFTSACANPGSVFPTLLKLSMHHSAKMDTKYYEILKTELMGKLVVENPFPSALSLDNQGRFILGYYHQTQDFFTAKKDKENMEEENNV